MTLLLLAAVAGIPGAAQRAGVSDPVSAVQVPAACVCTVPVSVSVRVKNSPLLSAVGAASVPLLPPTAYRYQMFDLAASGSRAAATAAPMRTVPSCGSVALHDPVEPSGSGTAPAGVTVPISVVVCVAMPMTCATVAIGFSLPAAPFDRGAEDLVARGVGDRRPEQLHLDHTLGQGR